MKYEQLLKYMSMLIDLEKNAYIQEKTIRDLESSASALAIPQQILKPGKIQYSAEEEGKGAGIVVGIIVSIIGFFVYSKILADTASDTRFGSIFGMAVITIILGVLSGVIIGGVVSFIVNRVLQAKYNREAEEGYQYRLKEYNKMLEKENDRIKKEKRKKDYLEEQISILSKQRGKTLEMLRELYEYGVLDERYRHDIVAICTLYQYLKAGQTYSLKRDNETGDQGAYNIYENAYLTGLVLKKLDDVIDKMDVIIQNQSEIVRAIRESNSKIKELESSVINETNRISRRIENSNDQQAALQYSIEQNNSMLAFRNTMDVFYSWK